MKTWPLNKKTWQSNIFWPGHGLVYFQKLKNLTNLLVDFYLCFRLPWRFNSQGFFEGYIWHRCFNILGRVAKRIKHARKHVRLSPEKIGKGKSHVVSSCAEFLIAFDSCTFSRQKTDRTHICPPVVRVFCSWLEKVNISRTFLKWSDICLLCVLLIWPVLIRISENPSQFFLIISDWIIHNLFGKVSC